MKKLRLKKNIKKGLLKTLLFINIIGFVLCGFNKDCYLLGFILLISSFYINYKIEKDNQ